MIAAQSHIHTVVGFRFLPNRQTPSSLSFSSSSASPQFVFKLGFCIQHCRKSKVISVSCKSSSSGRFGHGSTEEDAGESDREYLEASVLISETVRHYHLRMKGFQDDSQWRSSAPNFPFSARGRDPRPDVNTLAPAFLRRFQSPTIFLKISCDGDFLLPVLVGEFAVEKLIESSSEDGNVDCPNQFQLVANLVDKLGYRVSMVKITKRVVNTYFARIFFYMPGEKDILSVDVRPSDAINVAQRCRAPIYVNKQIVLMDGFRFSFGTGRMRDEKTVYDVTLDSAIDGPDVLTEELDLMKNINLAVEEERYNDAVMLRDKLVKLRESRNKH